MSKWKIWYDVGYGRKEELIEADDTDEAAEAAYEAFSQACEACESRHSWGWSPAGTEEVSSNDD